MTLESQFSLILSRILRAVVIGAVLGLLGGWQFQLRDWTSDGKDLFFWYSKVRIMRIAAGPDNRLITIAGHELDPEVFLSRVQASAWREQLESAFNWIFKYSPLIGASAGVILAILISRPKRGDPHQKHRRGAQIVTWRKLRRLARKAGRGDIEIGGVPIPRNMEPYHFLISGAIGTGKSVAISRMLDSIRERGERAVIADSGGLFLQRYYRPSDVILNPFDARSVPWSPLAEMEGAWDADALAASIIPDGHGEGAQWNHYSQTLLSAILTHLFQEGGNNASLFHYSCLCPLEDLAMVVAGTPAQALLSAGQEKFAGSVKAILGTYLSPFQHLPPEAGADGFSIRRFIESGKGWLFVSYRDDQLQALRPLVGATLDIVARSILSLSEHRERRIWVVADELPSLGRVQSLEAFATKARKYGGAAILGLQSIAQLYDRYGQHQAQAILSSLSTWLTLRPNDPETSRFMSRALGDQEVLRRTEGGSEQPAGRSSSTWHEQLAVESVALPSELQSLPNLQGFLSLAGDFPLARVKLPLPAKRPKAAEAFVPRPRQQAQPAKPLETILPEKLKAGATDIEINL